MIKSSFFGIFFLILFISSWTHANQTLDSFYQSTRSLQANFTQTIRTTRGKVIEQSTGKLLLDRPDKFILEYIAPAEQKYISNGKTIWIYDVELEQVSIKNISDNVGDSPALLLSSNKNIYRHYDVNDLKNFKDDGLDWVELRAKQEEMIFEKVILAFADKELKKMIMYDSFGQVTQLNFSNMTVNIPFSSRQFNFVPPEGVDIMGSENVQ
ncbi:outer membrane lipoprotein chaperone LolA [sulfur-oxidizing endosymbiont of Gigantopelta aegis]|uniref:outer membrane lipoprotein chaperone LolA n=1 Tax=sulfur-oxidizing endosymbiont of Gigantopelta aegis TaxID=2794934 RepID=UPI0018DBCD5C|nr:outer membrane lipoprotein chaperone LolA [sulfur-oxidizing endosymbiont of Gigantopelta aegis]